MISVCIATYNGEKFLKEQLVSILSQLGNNDEIIISDDSSTDKTMLVVNSFNDKRIKIFENQSFSSPIYNFENAIKHAQGDYIFLSDQDDIWLSSKVERTLYYLKENDLVLSDCKIVDENLNVLNDSFFAMMSSRKGFFSNLIRNSYMGCCMAFKKEILDYILPFPKNLAMHDSWIGLSVELNGNSFFLNEPLILYRRHDNNASFTSKKSQYPLTYKIRYRLKLIFDLLYRKYKLLNWV